MQYAAIKDAYHVFDIFNVEVGVRKETLVVQITLKNCGELL